ncbi:MAG: alpha-amylase family glycosyl hydrolase [Chloroherpetonaceae bacterium]|nr:alpha-amylase family glycosyl hydrolase [Chloroherpetonaceae bacterium]
MPHRRTLALLLLFWALSLDLFAQNAPPVMIQGFYWDVTPGGVWYDTLRLKADLLKRAGISAIWLPPVYKSDNQNGVGYLPYDFYDLGEYDNTGGNVTSGIGQFTATRYGTYPQLAAMIAEYKRLGMQVYADIVFNHRGGGIKERNPFLPIACPPGGASDDSSFTNFPLTNGSRRLTANFNHFYPNAAVNPSNVSNYCSSNIFGFYQFYTNDFGQDIALHDNAGNNLPMGDSIIVWGNWLKNRLQLDGFRIDFIKGFHPEYYKRWVDAVAERTQPNVPPNKFVVAELYDGDINRLRSWLNWVNENGANPRTSLFDFNLYFGMKDVFQNPAADIRQLQGRGLFNNGVPPTQIVTFVENHDFDRNNYLGVPSLPDHNPFIINKHLAYAYILTTEGYPCIWWRDYFIYGLRDDINKLLAVRRWARGTQEIPTNAAASNYQGSNAPFWPGNQATDERNVMVIRRYGNPAPLDSSGVLVGINKSNFNVDVWVTCYGWGNKWLRDITGNAGNWNGANGDSTFVFPATATAGPRVRIRVPANSYAVYVPTYFRSPYQVDFRVDSILVADTLATTTWSPVVQFRNLSSLSQTGMRCRLTIARATNPQTILYADSVTTARIQAGETFRLSFRQFQGENNERYVATAIISGSGDDDRSNDTLRRTFLMRIPPVPPQFALNGVLNESGYFLMATNPDSSLGFGPNIDIRRIWFGRDDSLLYIGVEGKLNALTSDGFGLWLDFGNVSGRSANRDLGNVQGASHFINTGDSTQGRYRSRFETDFAFSLSPVSNRGFMSLARYDGNASASGSIVATAPNSALLNGSNVVVGPSASGAVPANSIAYSANNSGAERHGWEFSIPLSLIGGRANNTIRGFAFVVSNTAYFSNVLVPATRVGRADAFGNLGFNPNFAADSMAADGPYVSPTFSIETGQMLTAKEGASSLKPTSHRLFQNYPNPFNPSTVIGYELPTTSDVRLEVFDVLGRKIATLVSARQEAGAHRVAFDASRYALSSGVYFYRLQAGEFAQTRKMTFVK